MCILLEFSSCHKIAFKNEKYMKSKNIYSRKNLFYAYFLRKITKMTPTYSDLLKSIKYLLPIQTKKNVKF